MENKNELEVAQIGQEITPIADDQLLVIAEQAEKRIEAVNKIKRIALRVTNVRDWLNQGGKPYLAVSGSEKVARLFGISWRLEEPHLTHEEGGHFRFEYKGEFSMGVVSIEAIGIRSSKDPFFAKKYDKVVPPSEIDKGDVKKSAFTNCVGNGVTRLLGIRNMDWDDLKNAGIDINNIGIVEYKKREGTETTETISEPQAKRLWAIATKHFTEQGISSGDVIKVTKEIFSKYGFKDAVSITRDKYETIIKEIENCLLPKK